MNFEWDGRRGHELFRLLGRVLDQCGPTSTKHDQVIVSIDVCIIEGANTRPLIVASIKAHGFNPKHVAIILNNGTGDDPERHRWQRDDEGHYRLH